MNKSNLIGKLVDIKNPLFGTWGTIVAVEGTDFSVSVLDDENEVIILERDEFTVPRIK